MGIYSLDLYTRSCMVRGKETRYVEGSSVTSGPAGVHRTPNRYGLSMVNITATLSRRCICCTPRDLLHMPTLPSNRLKSPSPNVHGCSGNSMRPTSHGFLPRRPRKSYCRFKVGALMMIKGHIMKHSLRSDILRSDRGNMGRIYLYPAAVVLFRDRRAHGVDCYHMGMDMWSCFLCSYT